MDAIENLLDMGLNTRYEDLPSAVVERTRMAILDTLGASIAGMTGEGVAPIAQMYQSWGGTTEATALALGQKLPMPAAAMLNGICGRAWDLDDVHEQNTCHVNVNVVPAILAVAEGRGPIHGRDFLSALAIGAEMVCRTSAASRISFSETGSSMSYQCGFYGAALASARLLGLSKDQARHALGIAHARLAGNQQGYIAGAMTVRLMQGVAVEGGLLSALMAEKGVTGSSEILEGKFGYFPVYHRGKYDRHALLDGLGKTWLLMEVSLKPAYPCCKYTHGPIEATVEAMKALGITANEVEKITVKVTNREVHDLVCLSRERKWNPQSLTDAQFSLPFNVAYAAANGGVDVQTFQPAGLANPAARALLSRVDVDLDLAAQGEGRGTFPMPGIVKVQTTSGRSIDKTVVYVKGHPKNPMNYEDVAAKFRTCAALGRPGWKGAEAVIDAVRQIEQLQSAGDLARLCAG